MSEQDEHPTPRPEWSRPVSWTSRPTDQAPTGYAEPDRFGAAHDTGPTGHTQPGNAQPGSPPPGPGEAPPTVAGPPGPLTAPTAPSSGYQGPVSDPSPTSEFPAQVT